MVFTVRTLYKECTHRILLHMFAYDPMNLDIFSHSTRDVEAATALRPWAPIFPLAVNWTSLFVARAFLPQHNTRKLNTPCIALQHVAQHVAKCCRPLPVLQCKVSHLLPQLELDSLCSLRSLPLKMLRSKPRAAFDTTLRLRTLVPFPQDTEPK